MKNLMVFSFFMLLFEVILMAFGGAFIYLLIAGRLLVVAG